MCQYEITYFKCKNIISFWHNLTLKKSMNEFFCASVNFYRFHMEVRVLANEMSIGISFSGSCIIASKYALNMLLFVTNFLDVNLVNYSFKPVPFKSNPFMISWNAGGPIPLQPPLHVSQPKHRPINDLVLKDLYAEKKHAQLSSVLNFRYHLKLVCQKHL